MAKSEERKGEWKWGIQGLFEMVGTFRIYFFRLLQKGILSWNAVAVFSDEEGRRVGSL